MFPEYKVTEIYCMADDFCKEFTFLQEKYMIEDKKTSLRKSCWEHVPASVSSTPLFYVSAVTKESLFIRHLMDLPNVENVQWDGSSDSSYI